MTQDRASALKAAGHRLLRRRGSGPAQPNTARPWDAAFFSLPQVERYAAADEARRDAVLDACAASVLAESWTIEKSGIVFCARMIGAAESVDEERMYALIAADEATHSRWLESWVDAPGEADPFNRFIAALVDAGSPPALVYLLQVVLEGFGIAHYARLAAEARDPALAATLRRMARDEGLHHAGGLAAFSVARLTDADRVFLAEASFEFLEMIRNGPQAIVAALDRHIGVGDESDAARVFEALAGEGAAAVKLKRLRLLMARPGMEWLVDVLAAKGAYTPCTPAQSAKLYAGMRSSAAAAV